MSKSYPWTSGTWDLFGGRLIRATNGEVAIVLAETLAPYRPGVGLVRAGLEEQANGKLMAAAPAMAKALVALVEAPGMVWQTPEELAAKERAIALLDSVGWKWE